MPSSPDHGRSKAVSHSERRATRPKGGAKHVDGTDGFGQMLRGLGQRAEAAAFVIQVSFLGDAKSSLGDAKSSLGDVKSSLGDAKSLLGDGELAG